MAQALAKTLISEELPGPQDVAQAEFLSSFLRRGITNRQAGVAARDLNALMKNIPSLVNFIPLNIEELLEEEKTQTLPPKVRPVLIPALRLVQPINIPTDTLAPLPRRRLLGRGWPRQRIAREVARLSPLPPRFSMLDQEIRYYGSLRPRPRHVTAYKSLVPAAAPNVTATSPRPSKALKRTPARQKAPVSPTKPSRPAGRTRAAARSAPSPGGK
jgi:hypothetical protein